MPLIFSADETVDLDAIPVCLATEYRPMWTTRRQRRRPRLLIRCALRCQLLSVPGAMIKTNRC